MRNERYTLVLCGSETRCNFAPDLLCVRIIPRPIVRCAEHAELCSRRHDAATGCAQGQGHLPHWRPKLTQLSVMQAFPKRTQLSVMQAFPAAFTAEEADPWLMLDHFGPSKSKGKETGPDDFPIGWHPHRGMDILTYMGKHLLCSSITLSPYLPFKNLTCLCLWCFLSTVEGKVRHADSMGNRGAWLVQRGEVMAAHGAVLAHPFSCVTGACSITPFAASADQCLCSRNGIVQRCSHFRVSPASCCLLASHRDGGHARHAVDFGGQRHRACRGGRHARWAGRPRLPDL